MLALRATFDRYPQAILFLFCSHVSVKFGAGPEIAAIHILTRRMNIFVPCLAAATCLCAAARADPAPAPSLPGVQGGHSIVQPMPEPETPPAVNDDGSIQIGKTRVKISGSVTVDIGVGATGEPHN